MNTYDQNLITFSDEEEMDIGESSELGEEGNPGQGIVGVREAPKNTGKIEMEGVAGNGKVGSPSYSNCPTKSPPNVHPPKQGETSDQAIKAFLYPFKKYLAGQKAKGGTLDIPKNPNGDLKEPRDGVPPECVTPYPGVGNFKQWC